MRFGIKTAPMDTTWDAMVDVWREADRIPLFESAWNFDHFEPIFSDRSGPCLEGWSTLAALAAVTTRIRIGCQVTGMPYRHPSVLANMAATVDIISGGRLELGLGAGWNQDEADALGIRLPHLKERFDQFDEAIEVIVSLLTQERASFEGQHFTLREAYCEPKPIQRPHPPIAIGGNGRTRTLRTVARWAQHWNSISQDPVEWQANRAVLHDHCATIGRDPAEIETSVLLRLRGEDDPAALAPQVEMWQEAGADVCIVYLAPPHTAAAVTRIADVLTPYASEPRR